MKKLILALSVAGFLGSQAQPAHAGGCGWAVAAGLGGLAVGTAIGSSLACQPNYDYSQPPVYTYPPQTYYPAPPQAVYAPAPPYYYAPAPAVVVAPPAYCYRPAPLVRFYVGGGWGYHGHYRHW